QRHSVAPTGRQAAATRTAAGEHHRERASLTPLDAGREVEQLFSQLQEHDSTSVVDFDNLAEKMQRDYDNWITPSPDGRFGQGFTPSAGSETLAPARDRSEGGTRWRHGDGGLR